MEQQVEFDIKIEHRDMYDFLMRHFYSSFSGIFGVLLSVGALVFFFLGLGKRDAFQLVVLLMLGLLFTVVQPLQMWIKAAAQLKANPMLCEPVHFLFDEKGMTVSQQGESASLPWEQIRRIRESKRSLFIYTSSINANILPKAQLQDELEKLRQIIKANAPASVYRLH